MKNKMIHTVLIFLLVTILCSCTNSGPAADTQKTADERLSASKQQIIEPVYIYLPDAASESENLIFHRWISGETPVAEYQDVTENSNTFAIPSLYGVAGETITTPLRICGNIDLCAFDLRIIYDTDKLEFVGYENADDDLLVNCDSQAGVLYVNFLRVIDLDDSFSLCDLRFKVLATEECESLLRIEVVEAVSLDKYNEIIFCPFSTVDGVVYMNSTKR